MGVCLNRGNTKEYLGITINYDRDKLIPEKGLTLLTKEGFYKKEWEDSPQETLARPAVCFCFGDYDFAQRIYDYASKGWFTYASPVLSTAVNVEWPHFTKRQFHEASDWLAENVVPDGQPISCFLSLIPDTREGLVSARSEISHMSMSGGGIGIFPSNRSPDSKSTGVMAHLKGYDSDTLAYKQSKSRRGSAVAYMDYDNPEIMQFLAMRSPTEGGDANKKCFNLNNAVNLTDEFMIKVIKGESYELVDPKHGRTGKFLNARDVWNKILDMRFETGEPYILFIDTVNRNIPSWITKPTYKVRQSNLCSEIVLMTSSKRSAVCCLSSLNIEKIDEWENAQIVEDVTRFLDNVLEYFIRLAPKELSRAVYSAKKERALGLGSLGWNSYFQSKMMPFESGGPNSAASESYRISKLIRDRAIESSKKLAKERGEPEDCRGSGMRNSHLTAYAPNASSSDFVGASPSTEPFSSNAFVGEGRAGTYIFFNKYLEELLIKKGLNTKEVRDEIMSRDGSVQWMEELSDFEKSVFKTAKEIKQEWIIELASIRQPNVCQAMSTNLWSKKNTTRQEMSDLIFLAWKKGLKSLYYNRGEKAKKAGNRQVEDNQPLNHVKVDINFEECLSCSG